MPPVSLAKRVVNSLLVALFAVADGGLRGREAGDRDAERGAGHVVQADLVAELDALRVAAMLAADAAA